MFCFQLYCLSQLTLIPTAFWKSTIDFMIVFMIGNDRVGVFSSDVDDIETHMPGFLQVGHI